MLSLIEKPTAWTARWNLAESIGSRQGLLRALQFFIIVYLILISLVIAFSLPSGQPLTRSLGGEAIASILLIGSLCLHLVAAIHRNEYAVIDALLDASIVIVASWTLQSPVLSNSAFYIMLIVSSYLLVSRPILPLILLVIAANVLSSLGLQLLWTSTNDPVNQHALVQVWYFACLNLVAFPCIGILIYGLGCLLKRCEEEMAEVRRLQQSLCDSQQRLMSAEEMASLGQLSGSVAHEVNNHLSAVVTSYDLIQAQIDRHVEQGREKFHEELAQSIKRWVEIGRKAALHSTDFLRCMTAQTRSIGEGAYRSFSVETAIAEAVQLLRPACTKQGCQLHVQVDMDVHSLHGDPGKFSQLLFNLINNAVDAYDGLDERALQPIWVAAYQRDDSIVVKVTDSGKGIATEHQAHIFDYLFTTKPVGKGSGIGLAIVQSVVTEHFGGTIQVASQEGKGTTFTVTLPIRAVDHQHG